MPDPSERSRSARWAPQRGAALDAFCAALADDTAYPVLTHDLADYGDLIDAMHASDVDIAWLPPVLALRATSRGRAIPIALPVRGGTAFYSTALFTHPGSRIRDLTQLHGARAAWVDQQSAAGYLVIRASLRQRGIDLENLFASETFYGSHTAVGKAVLEGRADVGASFVHLDPRRSRPRRSGWGDAQVRMLATAGPIPNDMIAATIRTPIDKIRAVQKALLQPSDELRAAASALLGAEGFIEANSEHLAPIQDLLDHLDDRADLAPPSSHTPPGSRG
ncbi:phosphonate ABC transporter, periplasmic phosphonate-binding protein [Chondromyces apiculatus DSM 436]|uniref:Phosphonate ABC transporter, periplasmic phosphonate-binding protein n=1 Tax=Chondromyces apiculatus DSM 436 TaxID=1192034 RepID=A0A017TBD9_9BACT|nr:phosphonate ABC transporter, periplasmic phosphonate-binding protein [Chondromyces apiculatus DSM 436]